MNQPTDLMPTFVRWYSIDYRGMTMWHRWRFGDAVTMTLCGRRWHGGSQYHVKKPTLSEGRCSVCFIAERKRSAARRALLTDGQRS